MWGIGQRLVRNLCCAFLVLGISPTLAFAVPCQSIYGQAGSVIDDDAALCGVLTPYSSTTTGPGDTSCGSPVGGGSIAVASTANFATAGGGAICNNSGQCTPFTYTSTDATHFLGIANNTQGQIPACVNPYPPNSRVYAKDTANIADNRFNVLKSAIQRTQQVLGEKVVSAASLGVTTLQDAISAIGSVTTTTLRVDKTLTASAAVVTNNITLEVVGGGLIDCNNASGAATISRVVAPRRQIFTNCPVSSAASAGISFGQNAQPIFPEWWGGTVTNQLQGALAALSTTYGGTVDATAYSGTQTLAGDPLAVLADSHGPVRLLLGSATYNPSTTFVPTSHLHVTIDGTITPTANTFVSNIFQPKLYKTTGTIAAGDNQLTVASTTGAEVGNLVGVKAANGGTLNQATNLNGAILAGDGVLTVDSTTGWAAISTPVLDSGLNGSPNALIIDNEIITFTTGDATHFGTSGGGGVSVTRGAYGTAAVGHSDRAVVKGDFDFVTSITAINGNVLTLADNATIAVTDAPVRIGTQDIRLDGHGTIDGKLDRADTDPAHNGAAEGFIAFYCRWCVIGDDLTFKRLYSGGVELLGGWDFYIGGAYEYISRNQPSPSGFDVGVWGQSRRGYVQTRHHISSGIVAFLDDRSSHLTHYDGNFQDIVEHIGPISDSTDGLFLQGGTHNTFYLPSFHDVYNIAIWPDDGQWTTNIGTKDTTIYFGDCTVTTCIFIGGDSDVENENITIIGGLVTGTVTDQGTGNIIQYSSASGQRITFGAGATPVSGDFTLTGWGSGASVGTISGSIQRTRFVVTAGTGPSVNPTVKVRIPAGTFNLTPMTQCTRAGGTDLLTIQPVTDCCTSSGPDSLFTLTFPTTPNPASVYSFVCTTTG